MKIAQMTWFNYHNYGTVLQAFALNKFLEMQGHTVSLVNYTSNCIRDNILLPDVSLFNKGKRKVQDKMYRNNHHIYESKERENKFEKFISKLDYTLKCETYSDLLNLNCSYDAFVCGSDQIWSPLNFNPHYFLDYVIDTSKMIAYAPSIGVSKIENKYIEKRMGELIGRFKHLSIRENQAIDAISKYANTEVYNCVDPTLLLNKGFWGEYAIESEIPPQKYLLCYFLGGNKKHYSEAYKIAEKLGLCVFIIPVFEEDLTRKGNVNVQIGPLDFLGLIKNADYVCTDSFHGVAFSLIFEKQFTVFERFNKRSSLNQNSRINNILSSLNIQNRLFNSNYRHQINLEINYKIVNNSLDSIRNNSKDYLLNSIRKIGETKRELIHIGKNLDLCCGCGVCSSMCPQNAININLNNNGFLSATVDIKKCVNCGICKSVCPFQGEMNARSIKDCSMYSIAALDQQVLIDSSSGGAGYLIAENLLNNGYFVVGCSFNSETQDCHHISVKSKGELKLIQGSKYMQSDLSNILEKLKKIKQPFVVFGTPCQIAGVRKLIEKNKLKQSVVLVDLICHGIPSRNVWLKYKEFLKENNIYTNGKINVNFRYKPKGWKEKYILITTSDGQICEHQDDNYYFRMFESCNAFSTACYECRWRKESFADLRIGDYWGPRFKNNTTGVNMIIAVTKKGEKIITTLRKNQVAEIFSGSIEDYYKYQQTMNLQRPVYYEELMSELNNSKNSIIEIDKKYVAPIFLERKLRKKINYIKEKL